MKQKILIMSMAIALLCMVASVPRTVYAESSSLNQDQVLKEKTGIAELADLMVKERSLSPELQQEQEEVDQVESERLFKKAFEYGVLSLDEEGFVVLDDAKVVDELVDYVEKIKDAVPSWNLAIHWGFIVWDEETGLFTTPEITGEFMTERVEYIIEEEPEDNTYLTMVQMKPMGAVPLGCSCNYAKKDATAICSQNYETIRSYYHSMLLLSGIDPWGATVGYWISYVENYGEWDYKRHWDGKATYCFKIKGIEGKHETAAWFGNYNYGYTGKLLFPLAVLKAGSFAVGKFQMDDVITDWPVIEMGFNDAP